MPQHLTNYSTGTRTYLYHPKEGGPKGANRLCTVLYHEIRRVKHGKHPARFARNLYLVADNAADNKNNDVIGFCCELVSRKWFDSVEFAFGEVGHTHNGEDAAHHVLNECVGRHVALTLGEHVLNYEKVWENPAGRPEAVLVQDQYDWKKRYESPQVVHRLAGFTKTKCDPESVHAFKVRRSVAGAVEVLWKKRAADTTWLGHDGRPAMLADGRGSDGFMCLKKVPSTQLELAPWNAQLVDKSHVPELKGLALGTLCSDTYMQPEAQQWIITTVNNGRVEPHSVVEAANAAVWGPRVLVGAPGKLGTMYQLLPVHDSSDFWELPRDILERDRLALAGATKAAVQHDLMPTIGYTHLPTARRPTTVVRREQEKNLLTSDHLLTSDQAHSEVALPTCDTYPMRKRARNPQAITAEADSAATQSPEDEDDDALGKVLGDLDEEQYQPREFSFQLNRFYLLRTDIDGQLWSVCQVVGKPELRKDELCVGVGLWMVEVMWWTKTANSKFNFVKELRKKQAAQDKGTDWTYCRSFDGEVTFKGNKTNARTLTLTDESAAMIESTVKTWYEEDGRKPPKSILAPARKSTKDGTGSDSDFSGGQSSSESS